MVFARNHPDLPNVDKWGSIDGTQESLVNSSEAPEPAVVPQPTVFIYPRAVFPPTDNHSAVHVATSPTGSDAWPSSGFIYILGCTGYQGDRNPTVTPVYRLNCDSYAIERVPTTGGPGWFSNAATAVYDPATALLTLTFAQQQYPGSRLVKQSGAFGHITGSATLDISADAWTHCCEVLD